MDLSFHENLILTGIEYAIFMILLSKIMNENIRGIIKPILIYMPIYFFIEILKCWIPDAITIIFMYASFTLFVRLVFRKEIVLSVFVSIYSAILMFFLQYFFTGLLILLINEMEFIFKYGLIVMTISFIAAIASYLFVPLYKATEALDEKNELLNALVSIAFIFMSVMYFIKLAEIYLAFTHSLILGIASAILLFLSLYAVKNILEIKGYKKAIELYNHYEATLSEISDKQHDFGNHLNTVYALASLNDDSKTSAHIKKYLNDLKIDSEFTDAELLKISRKPLAAFLHIKMLQLRSSGVYCWVNVYDYEIKSKIKDYVLVEAVGILIDNAWEAGNENDKDVIINILKQKDGTTTIQVMNKFCEISTQEWDAWFKRGYSTKGEKRGKGLYNLDKIITEHKCKLAFQNIKRNGDNYVCFTLIL